MAGAARGSVFLAAAALCLAAAGETAFAVRDAHVVCPDSWVRTRNPDREGMFAILDLTNALSKVTGAAFPVHGENAIPPGVSGPVIYLGDVAASRAAGLADPKLRNLDARVKVVPGAAYLYSRTAAGTESAVIEFLRRVADFWYLTVTAEDPYVRNRTLRRRRGSAISARRSIAGTSTTGCSRRADTRRRSGSGSTIRGGSG